MLDLSRKDWEARLRAGQSLLPDLEPVNPELAARAVRNFNRLRIPDVPGTPAMAEACGDWFREIVSALFGALDPETGVRAIQELFLLVPKKNSKTTNGAGLMLTALTVNERPNAEFLIVAPTKEIADLAFSQALGMVQNDRTLMQRFHAQTHLKRLTFRSTGATLQVKAFSPDVMTGVKPAGVLVDEQHVIAMRNDAGSVMRQIRGGMISQPEAFLAIITTQSDGPPRGVFAQDLIRAREIRDGKRFQPVLPVLYELPPDIQQPSKLPGEAAPWEDPAYWPMVLPNLGRSITLDRLRREYEDAREKGVGELASWASQHLNVEIGLALRSDRWVGADYWQGAGDDTLTLEALIERCEVIVAGIDGGGLDDLLSLAVLGRDTITGQWLHWQKSWVFEGVLALRKREASQLRDFETQGDLVITAAPGDDIDQLVAVPIIEFVRQKSFTNKAAPVAEGAAKPYSDMSFELSRANVAVIAHLFKASKQALDDAPELVSIINAQGVAGLEQVEEYQFMYGDGTGANILGLMKQATAFAAPAGLAVPDVALDTIRMAMLQASLALYPATGIVLHEIDWFRITSVKDGIGRYVLGDPQSVATRSLWGLPVVVSNTIRQGDFLVGAFATGAQIFDRQSVAVEVATVGDDFEKNMVTVRIEERTGLVVYRQQSFITGTLPPDASAGKKS